MPSDVTMPDGTVITDVPDGTTKAQLQAKYGAHLAQQPEQSEPVFGVAIPPSRTKADFSQFKNARQPITTRTINIGPAGSPTAEQQWNMLAGQVESLTSKPSGMFGDTEAFGRDVLRHAGVPVSAEPMLPTSEFMGNLEWGQPTSPEQAAGRERGVGTFLAPQILGKTVGAYARGTDWLARPIVGGLNKAKEWATGSGFTDPYATATQRLAQSVNNPQRMLENIRGWRGESDPSFMDIAGSDRTLRLARSAASDSTGDASTVAKDYAKEVAANLQGNTSTLARGLTPNEARSADVVAEELKTRQSQQAQADYAPLNQIKIQPSKEMVSALQGPEGRAAINRAYAAARARRDVQQMAELKDLQAVANEQSGGVDPLTGRKRSLEQALSEVSAGTLDRVHIAMRGIASNLYEKAPDIAGGYASRDTDINQVLKQSPEVSAARAPYRSLQAEREALEAGREAFRTPSDEYAATIARQSAISPNARQAAGVGYRQDIVNSIETPKAGATGYLNKLGSAARQGENLATTFGAETAADFQKGIQDEVSRAENARFIDPRTGSQTFSHLVDTGLIGKMASGNWFEILKTAADWVRRGGPLTEAEREAIVRLAKSQSKGDWLRVIEKLPENSRPAARQILIPGPAASSRRAP